MTVSLGGVVATCAEQFRGHRLAVGPAVANGESLSRRHLFLEFGLLSCEAANGTTCSNRKPTRDATLFASHSSTECLFTVQ